MSKRNKPKKAGRDGAETDGPATDGQVESAEGERTGLASERHEAKPKLDREDLYRVETLYLKMELAQAKKENCELRAQLEEQRALLHVRSLRADAELHSRDATTHRSSAQAFMLSLGPKYGVDFTKATYDDESGAITVIEEPDSPAKT